MTPEDLQRCRRQARVALNRESDAEPWRQAGWPTRWHQELAFEAVLEIIPPGAGAECLLLDVGCGLGELCGYLRSRGRRIRYRGIDAIDFYVARAQRRFPAADIAVGDIFGLDPTTARADYVVSVGAMRTRMDDASWAGRFVRGLGRLARRAAALTFPTDQLPLRSGWIHGVRDRAFHDPRDLYSAARSVAPFVSIREELAPGYAVLSMQHGVPANVGRFARAVAIEVGEAEGHEAAGSLLLGAELFEAALAELELGRERGRNLSMRAEAAFNLRRIDEAEALCLRALELEPHAEAWLGAGVAAALRGDRELAISRLREGAEAHPLHESLQTKLALVLLDAGDAEGALAVARSLGNLEPGKGAYLEGLAHLHRGDFTESRRCLERAVEVCPDYVAALATLAAACEQLDDVAAAVKWYRRVVTLHPEHPAALDALRRLGGIEH